MLSEEFGLEGDFRDEAFSDVRESIDSLARSRAEAHLLGKLGYSESGLSVFYKL